MECLVKQAEIMCEEYTVICTNPPYLNKLDDDFKKFINKNYKDFFGDLFSVSIYRNLGYCKADGYVGFMTPFVWRFIKTYEKLREFIIQNKSISTLIQMEYSAFEEATVPICSFVLQNCKSKNRALCFRLSDFKGGMEVQREKVLEAIANPDCGYFYESDQSNFSKIPGLRVGWLVSKDTELLNKVVKYKHYLSICDSVPSEYLTKVALKHNDEILARNTKIIEENIKVADAFFDKYDYLFEKKPISCGPVAFHKLLIDMPGASDCSSL